MTRNEFREFSELKNVEMDKRDMVFGIATGIFMGTSLMTLLILAIVKYT